MNGVLIIDKVAGPTSHDVVAKVRKILKIKKVGHTGTLDPAATGVLPLVLGKGTKLARYLTGQSKAYRATIELGKTTTTLDRDGDIVRERPVNTSVDELIAAVESFVGDIEQIPPMYSAKKIDGKRLYELARKGVEVEREPKKVKIYGIDVVNTDLPEFTLDVHCSAGTYIRVLAEDLGEKLGCGGYLKALRRTASGCFRLEEAITLAALADEPELGKQHLVSLGDALDGFMAIKVPKHMVRAITAGQQLTVADLGSLDLPDFQSEDVVTLRSDAGELIAIAKALVGREDLSKRRLEHLALKTERVLADSLGSQKSPATRPS